jgi:hypothetical protein
MPGSEGRNTREIAAAAPSRRSLVCWHASIACRPGRGNGPRATATALSIGLGTASVIAARTVRATRLRRSRISRSSIPGDQLIHIRLWWRVSPRPRRLGIVTSGGVRQREEIAIDETAASPGCHSITSANALARTVEPFPGRGPLAGRYTQPPSALVMHRERGIEIAFGESLIFILLCYAPT